MRVIRPMRRTLGKGRGWEWEEQGRRWGRSERMGQKGEQGGGEVYRNFLELV